MLTRLARILSLALVIAVASPAAPVAAQGVAERAAARQLIDDGKTAYKAKRFKKAAKLFKQAYDLDPRQKVALYNRAFALRKGKLLKEARAAYLEYIAVAPDDAQALFGLAETERQLGNRAEALRLFTEYGFREKRSSEAKKVAYARAKIKELQAAAAAGTGGGANKAQKKSHYDEGTAAYRAGRYRDAAEHFAKAFLKDSKRTDALYRRALALRKTADYPAAIGAYEAFLNKEPKNLDGLFGLAETHRLAGNPSEAHRLFKRYVTDEQRSGREKYVSYAQKQLAALASKPSGPSVVDKVVGKKLLADGKKLYRAKDYKKATNLFQQAQRADPDLFEAVYREGLAQRRGGDLDAAADAYGRFLEKKSDDPDGHYGLAETNRLRKDVLGARKHFRRYIDLETRASEGKYIERAKVYLAQTEAEATKLAAASAGETKPAGEDSTSNAATAETEDPKSSEAGSSSEDSSKGSDQATKTAEAKSSAVVKQGDQPTASQGGVPLLGATAELHSSQFAQRITVDGLIDHGNVALASGAPEKAARHFALASALLPEDPLPHLLLGRALEAASEQDKARTQYRKVLELTPEGRLANEARSRLASTVARTGTLMATPEQTAEAALLLEKAAADRSAKDFDAALVRLKEAARIDPGNIDVYFMTGQLQLDRGHGLPALQAYQRALALDPSRAAPLYGIARAYELAGERRVALHHYRLYTRSEATDVDPKLRQKAWMKVEGLEWPPGGNG